MSSLLNFAEHVMDRNPYVETDAPDRVLGAEKRIGGLRPMERKALEVDIMVVMSYRLLGEMSGLCAQWQQELQI